MARSHHSSHDSERHAVHAVTGASRRIVYPQAVHVGGEAGETLLEVLGEPQVVQDRWIALAEALAWHDQRKAWRVWHQHGGGDTPPQALDGHRLHPAAHPVVIGLAGRHGEF